MKPSCAFGLLGLGRPGRPADWTGRGVGGGWTNLISDMPAERLSPLDGRSLLSRGALHKVRCTAEHLRDVQSCWPRAGPVTILKPISLTRSPPRSITDARPRKRNPAAGPSPIPRLPANPAERGRNFYPCVAPRPAVAAMDPTS